MLGTQYNSQMTSAPSYGFGTAERAQLNAKVFVSKDMCQDKYGMASPGPVYNPQSSGRRSSPSHSFGVSHRYAYSAQKRSGAPFPAPGQYALPGAVTRQHDSQKHSYSSWKFGTSTRNDQAKVRGCDQAMDDEPRWCSSSTHAPPIRVQVFVSPAHAKSVTEFIDSPGPAAYGHKGSIGLQSDSRKNTTERFGMGTQERFFERTRAAARGTPGPAAYSLRSSQGRQVSSTKASYPINSFPRADRDKVSECVYLGPKQQLAFWGRNSPGPAVYSPMGSVGSQVSSSKPSMPKFGFGTSDRFGYMNIASRAMQSPGPGTYSV